jgi:hypothetical protein
VLDFTQMRRYHWKFVIGRDFFALLAAFIWALRNYTDRWDSKKICNPTWQGFLSYVVLVVAALILIELCCWTIWLLRGVSRRSRKLQQLDEHPTPSVFINTNDLKAGVLNLAAGLLLLWLSIFAGGPTPCEPLRTHGRPWSLFLGSILCGLGILTIANGCVREEQAVIRH